MPVRAGHGRAAGRKQAAGLIQCEAYTRFASPQDAHHKATHAVERLKTRSGNPQFAAVAMAGGLFYLVDRSGGTAEKRCEPLPLDEFVKFVDEFGPKKPRKASKLDLAFEAQIKKSKG